MKLSEISATLTDLKATVSAWVKDKASATEAAIAGFSAKLTTLESGAVAELTQTQADLQTAKQTISTLEPAKVAIEKDLGAITAALDTACAAVKVEVAGKSPVEKITALQTSVSDTLAKLQVPADKIPAAKPAETASAADAKPKASGRELFTASIKIV